MKTYYLLLVAAVMCVMSCKTKQGDPGPTGAAGANGTAGANGLNPAIKQGSITGTFSYVDHKDSALSLPFNYEYASSVVQSEYSLTKSQGSMYSISVKRRDILDTTQKLGFVLFGNINGDGSFAPPVSGSFDFSYVTTINKSLFEFSGLDHSTSQQQVRFYPQSLSTCAISNLVLDTLSGRVTFQYTITYSPQDINYNDAYNNTTPATVTGSVDAILNRNRLSVLMPMP